MTTKELAHQLKQPVSVFPGGYSILIWTQDGPVCPACRQDKGRRREMFEAIRSIRYPNSFARGMPTPYAFEPYWEGRPEECVFCSALIESEYGDPDAPDVDDLATTTTEPGETP